MKINTYLNFVGLLLLYRYDVGNPLCISARLNKSCIKWLSDLLLNPTMND
jgi:hypothetical protein